MPEFTSLWAEASSDAEADASARKLHLARHASAPLWTFLGMAQNATEFGHRVELAQDRIDRIAAQAGLSQEEVRADLWRQFELRQEARRATAGENPFAKKDDDSDPKDSDNDGDADDEDDESDSDDSDDDDSDDSKDGDDGDDGDDDSDDDKDDSDSGKPWEKKSSLQAQAAPGYTNMGGTPFASGAGPKLPDYPRGASYSPGEAAAYGSGARYLYTKGYDHALQGGKLAGIKAGEHPAFQLGHSHGTADHAQGHRASLHTARDAEPSAHNERGPMYDPASLNEIQSQHTVHDKADHYTMGYDHAVSGQPYIGHGNPAKAIAYGHGWRHGRAEQGRPAVPLMNEMASTSALRSRLTFADRIAGMHQALSEGVDPLEWIDGVGGGQGTPEKPDEHNEGPDFSNGYSEVPAGPLQGPAEQQPYAGR